MLVVISIDSLMRDALCGKLHRPPSQLLFALQQSSIDSQVFVENRNFCLPHLHSIPPLGDLRPNIAITFVFGVEKLKWCGYPTVRELFIRFRRMHERDRQIDTALRHRPRLHSTARQKFGLDWPKL